jgi:hypothetical protein
MMLIYVTTSHGILDIDDGQSSQVLNVFGSGSPKHKAGLLALWLGGVSAPYGEYC